LQSYVKIRTFALISISKFQVKKVLHLNKSNQCRTRCTCKVLFWLLHR